MKHNLKTFPNWEEFSKEPHESFTKALYVYIGLINGWKNDFGRELREQLTPRIISAMAELVDDRSDFQKGWKIGYIDCLKQILGE